VTKRTEERPAVKPGAMKTVERDDMEVRVESHVA
jgi:hypothetical protein